MLSPQEVGRFLSHRDRGVRDHALRSLALAGERCGTTAEAAIQAIGQHGTAVFLHPEQVALLAQTDATIKAALEVLAHGNSTWARELLLELPQTTLAACRDKVASIHDLALRARLNGRLSLGEKRPEDLWQQVLSSVAGAARHDLVLALAPHDGFCGPQVLSMLSGTAGLAGGQGEVAIIELAGRGRFAAVVADLVDRLGGSDAAVAEAAALALGRIGTAGAVTIIEQRCNASSATVPLRLASARALGRFRVPSVEATLLRLLAAEDDRGVATALCIALADICTTGGLARLKQTMQTGRCDVSVAELREGVAALELMVSGAPVSSGASASPPRSAPARPAAKPPEPAIPQEPAWPELAGLRLSDDDEPLIAEATSVQAKAFADPPAGGAPAEPVPIASEPAPSLPPQVTEPLKRDAGRVGRNEPCPCGSGKKYKKCCGA